MGERMQQALAYFKDALNITTEQAAGIVGNLVGESGLNPSAKGDGGKAYGIAQWHPDRQANFKKQFGIDIRQSTFQQQLEFVAWELKNTERNAFNKLLGAGTIAEATQSFMRWFERPADWAAKESLPGRTQAAADAANGSGVLGALGVTTEPGSLEDKLERSIWGDGLVSMLNGEGLNRIVFIVIGVILIGLAIAAFVLVSGGDLKSAVVKAAL